MQAEMNPRVGVHALILDGKTIRPGEVVTVSRAVFDRVNARKALLLEVAEKGGGEPLEEPDEDGESSPDDSQEE